MSILYVKNPFEKVLPVCANGIFHNLKRHFSAAIRIVYALLVLMNRGLTSTYINANLNAIMAPADLFVPRGTRVLVLIIIILHTSTF